MVEFVDDTILMKEQVKVKKKTVECLLLTVEKTYTTSDFNYFFCPKHAKRGLFYYFTRLYYCMWYMVNGDVLIHLRLIE